MNKFKGFTIIELIVVIAIIAVLAAIVLVNVTQYIAKAKDATIKADMSTMVTNATTFYDENSTYEGLSETDGYQAMLTAISKQGGKVSGEGYGATFGAAGFCVEITLNDATWWCVDATGYKGAAADCNSYNYKCTGANS